MCKNCPSKYADEFSQAKAKLLVGVSVLVTVKSIVAAAD